MDVGVGIGADRLTPDFEWHQFPHAVEPGTPRGEEVGGALRKISMCTRTYGVEATEFTDAGARWSPSVHTGYSQGKWPAAGQPGRAGFDGSGWEAGPHRVLTDRREASKPWGFRSNG
jgi:hypothetical protein